MFLASHEIFLTLCRPYIYIGSVRGSNTRAVMQNTNRLATALNVPFNLYTRAKLI